MADGPTFRVDVPLRCWEFDPDKIPHVCARVATYVRRGANIVDGVFVCAKHRQATDEPIAGELIVRRVSLGVEVVFSAVSWESSVARGEAVDQLLCAVQQVHGVMNLHTVNLQTGRYTVPVPQGTANASRGDRR